MLHHALRAPGPDRSAFAGDAIVDTDVFCRRCGYNIRGLHLEGLCPECATPVHVSLHGDLLRFSDPQWLLMLTRGISLLFYGILVVVGAIVCQRIVLNSIVHPSIRNAALIIASFVPVGGVWLLTTPDPSHAGESAYGRWRRLTRILLLIVLAAAILYSATKKMPLPPEIHGSLLLITALGSIASIGGIVALLNFIRGLGRRLPDESIERLAGWLMYACPIAALTSVALESIRISRTIVALQSFHNRLIYHDLSAPALRLCAGVTLFADVILGVFFLALLAHLGRSLRGQPILQTEL
jgi:hypothetical protein